VGIFLTKHAVHCAVAFVIAASLPAYQGLPPSAQADVNAVTAPYAPNALAEWTPVYPPARGNPALVYDSVQAETIMFGGNVDNHEDSGLSDTWRYDGSVWRPVPTTTQPPPNRVPVLAYDPLRQRVVLFGGLSNATLLFSDTWEFNGSNWVKMTPVASPPARFGHSLVYDPQLQKVLLFGGQDLSTVYSDTWIYDGLTWTPLTPVTSPPARSGGSLAYDSGRQRVVLFGGGSGSNSYNDTWEFDGANWLQRTNTNPPSGRTTALAYDAARQRIVAFGGTAGSGPTVFDETWEFDGNIWQQRNPITAPRARATAGGMVYDSNRQRVVIFGNWCGHNDGGCRLADTWEYNGVNWALAVDLSYPFHRRFSAAMAYDLTRQTSVLFGGWKDGLGYTDETWGFDGNTWTQRNPAIQPSGRDNFRLAYDPLRQRTVLFGGNVVGYLDDTWEWDGLNWAQMSPIQKPSGRHSYGMAYDTDMGSVVLFGGETSTVFRADDTWIYSGTTWIELSPPVRPPGRAAHNMVYDSHRNRLVMFGGISITTTYSDTWEFDGATWTLITPTVSPPARAGFAMAYDSQRQVTVLFGGNSINGTQLADLWEYDGVTWTPRSTTFTPMGRSGAAMTYDSRIGQVVLSGGLYSGADTWLYGPAVPQLHSIYIPLALRNYLSYFPGPLEAEPNNTAAQANGPLHSAQDYFGYPNDGNDYFSFYTSQAGTITVDLSAVTGQGTQLQVFYQDTSHLVGFDASAPYQINLPGQPGGWYYVRVYTAGDYNNDTPYTLRVTYP